MDDLLEEMAKKHGTSADLLNELLPTTFAICSFVLARRFLAAQAGVGNAELGAAVTSPIQPVRVKRCQPTSDKGQEFKAF